MKVQGLDHHRVEEVVRLALQEDIGAADLTTTSLIPPEVRGRARIFTKQSCVLAGGPIAIEVFRQLDRLEVDELREEGSRLGEGETIMSFESRASCILTGERVALNFLQRLSGIATMTSRFADVLKGLKTKVIDTRKTAPGLRAFEKYAVRVGGGANHRFGLFDGILVKENHLDVAEALGFSLRDSVERIRSQVPHTLRIEVEVQNLEEVRGALEAGADAILLDNMPVEEMRSAVALCNGKVILEASGGITLENARSVAETGVDLISVGALTHSAPAVDISLDIEVLR